MAKRPNDAPRISVNKLAEFIDAKARRQRQILGDQKYPTDFKGMYYREASEAISSYIASNMEKASILDRAIAILEQNQPEKIGTRRRIEANIDALESFQTMLDAIDLGGAIPRLGANSQPMITIQNVNVSIRPDIILHLIGKGGVPLVGAIKLHFPRTFSLAEAGEGIVSAVMQEWVKTALPDDGEPSGAHCFAIDVGARRVGKGVKATVARLKDVQANCRNIMALWPTIDEDD